MKSIPPIFWLRLELALNPSVECRNIYIYTWISYAIKLVNEVKYTKLKCNNLQLNWLLNAQINHKIVFCCPKAPMMWQVTSCYRANHRPESVREYCVKEQFLKLVSQKYSCDSVCIYVVIHVDKTKHCGSDKIQFYSALYSPTHTEVKSPIKCKT